MVTDDLTKDIHNGGATVGSRGVTWPRLKKKAAYVSFVAKRQNKGSSWVVWPCASCRGDPGSNLAGRMMLIKIFWNYAQLNWWTFCFLLLTACRCLLFSSPKPSSRVSRFHPDPGHPHPLPLALCWTSSPLAHPHRHRHSNPQPALLVGLTVTEVTASSVFSSPSALLVATPAHGNSQPASVTSSSGLSHSPLAHHRPPQPSTTNCQIIER